MTRFENWSERELAARFDHTQLRPDAVKEDFVKLCEESVRYGFCMVAVNSAAVSLCKSLLGDSKVRVGAAIGFPLGQTTIETKLFEVKDAISNGADEIDYVINIGALKDGNTEYIQREMERIVSVCRQEKVTSKVIFENCYLTKREICIAAELAKQIKPHFIKTSTGFGSAGATCEDIRLMKRIVGDTVKIKAAGGIRTWEDCRAMLLAGAERIGTSAGINILNEFKSKETGINVVEH